MEKISKTWAQLKTLNTNYGFPFRYEEQDDAIYIWVTDTLSQKEYNTFIPKESGNADYEEWLSTYKAKADVPVKPLTEDGKEMVMAVSRPIGYNTFFTCAGDAQGEIGGGVELSWDFSNDNDEVSAPNGFKRKRIDFNFIDHVYLKEGTIYWQNAKKGSYINIEVVCPSGGYYYDNNGNPVQAQSDTVIHKFANHHCFFGDCPMGDELNTEACSSQIPSYMKYRIEVTVPDSDVDSNGHVSVELYRKRAVILE